MELAEDEVLHLDRVEVIRIGEVGLVSADVRAVEETDTICTGIGLHDNEDLRDGAELIELGGVEAGRLFLKEEDDGDVVADQTAVTFLLEVGGEVIDN